MSKWMNRMTSILPMQSCTRSLKKHEKLYRLATKKLSDVELDREEIFIKVDEDNQTIGVLQFENNFLAKKTKKLEAELFQVRAHWRGLQVQKLMRCSVFRNLLLIEPI